MYDLDYLKTYLHWGQWKETYVEDHWGQDHSWLKKTFFRAYSSKLSSISKSKRSFLNLWLFAELSDCCKADRCKLVELGSILPVHQCGETHQPKSSEFTLRSSAKFVCQNVHVLHSVIKLLILIQHILDPSRCRKNFQRIDNVRAEEGCMIIEVRKSSNWMDGDGAQC